MMPFNIEPIVWEDEDDLLNIFISFIPPYGVFNTSEQLQRLTNLPDFNNHEEINSLGGIESISERFRDRLVNYGYALRRYDLEETIGIEEPIIQIELTERGRMMKSAGGINSYSMLINEQEQKKLMEQKRLDEQHLLNRLIAFAAVTGALYYIVDLFLRYQQIEHRPSLLYVGTVVVIFLYGVIAGIIIYMLILKVLNRKNKA